MKWIKSDLEKYDRQAQYMIIAIYILLAVLSIVAAFMGTSPAQRIFSSFPVFLVFTVLAVLYVFRFIVNLSIRRYADIVPLAGLILILAGGFISSDRGNDFRNLFAKEPQPYSGTAKIYDGQILEKFMTEEGEADTGFVIGYLAAKAKKETVDLDAIVPVLSLKVEHEDIVLAKITQEEPLKFKNYLIYSMGVSSDEAGDYILLNVVKGTGRNLIFAGFVCLVAGLIIRFLTNCRI